MSPKRPNGLLEEALTRSVIAAFYQVYQGLGFGFREYIYSRALERVLVAGGHLVGREVPSTVYYRGEAVAQQVLDMIVDEKLVIEIKATEHLHPNASMQLFSYLSATRLEVGLLLHFGRKPKFHRVICENRLKRHLSARAPGPRSP